MREVAALPQPVAAFRDDGGCGTGGRGELIVKGKARQDDLPAERKFMIEPALLVEAHRKLDHLLGDTRFPQAHRDPVARDVRGIHHAIRAADGFALEPEDRPPRYYRAKRELLGTGLALQSHGSNGKRCAASAHQPEPLRRAAIEQDMPGSAGIDL